MHCALHVWWSLVPLLLGVLVAYDDAALCQCSVDGALCAAWRHVPSASLLTTCDDAETAAGAADVPIDDSKFSVVPFEPSLAEVMAVLRFLSASFHSLAPFH